MFVVYGKKLVFQTLGRLAEYCPFCRVIRAFRVRRIGQASHLYFVAFGSGEYVCHELTCEYCGGVVTQREKVYNQIARDSRENLNELVLKTNPDLEKEVRNRLELAERIRQGLLSPDERKALLVEPFVLLNSLIEARVAATHFDKRSGMGCLFSISALILALVAATNAPPASSESVLYSGLAICGMGFLYTFYMLHTDAQRYVRRNLYRPLLIALKPLEPTLQELEELLESLRAQGLAAGRGINPRELHEALALGILLE